MVTLIQREFTVGVPSQRAWDDLARAERWPSETPAVTGLLAVAGTSMLMGCE